MFGLGGVPYGKHRGFPYVWTGQDPPMKNLVVFPYVWTGRAGFARLIPYTRNLVDFPYVWTGRGLLVWSPVFLLAIGLGGVC